MYHLLLDKLESHSPLKPTFPSVRVFIFTVVHTDSLVNGDQWKFEFKFPLILIFLRVNDISL